MSKGGGVRHEAGFARAVMQPGGALDSRLGGHDRECRETSLPGVWGCPPDSLLCPQEWGWGVEHRE
jgi:hypothetical protein